MQLCKYIGTITVAALIFVSGNCFAQWEEDQINVLFAIPEVALIDIEPSLDNSVHFSILPSAESGSSPEVVQTTQQVLWVNYSSSMNQNVSSRKIIAEIGNGQLPNGVELSLEAGNYTGSGDGILGHSAGKIQLGNQPRAIITGIGNCYTNDGINNGHELNFSLNIIDYSKIHSNGEIQFTILYTITDN